MVVKRSAHTESAKQTTPKSVPDSPLSVPEREAARITAEAATENTPSTGWEYANLGRAYLDVLAALTDLEERAEREKELRARAKSQLREHHEGPGIRQAAESLLIRAEQAEERENRMVRDLAAAASHLHALGRPDLTSLIVCPRCDGQKYDVGGCGVCRNLGWLNEDGEALTKHRGDTRTNPGGVGK